MREARRAYGELELEEVEVLGRAAFVPRGLEPAPPHVRLLPRFDRWLLGHRDRSLIMREEHDKAVRPGGGILAATLVVDGLHRRNLEAGPRRPARRDPLCRPAGSLRRGGGRRQVPGQGALTGVYVRSWSA